MILDNTLKRNELSYFHGNLIKQNISSFSFQVLGRKSSKRNLKTLTNELTRRKEREKNYRWQGEDKVHCRFGER
jgi:hypothetical protein